jgi:hypothetical protein
VKKNENKRKTELPLKDLDLVTTKHWPRETDITCGDKSVSNLCDVFHLQNKRKYIQAFREYVDTKSKPKGFEQLFQITDSIPISTSEYERAFSAMNYIYTKKRNSLLEQAGRLIFLKSVRPPLGKFNLEP